MTNRIIGLVFSIMAALLVEAGLNHKQHRAVYRPDPTEISFEPSATIPQEWVDTLQHARWTSDGLLLFDSSNGSLGGEVIPDSSLGQCPNGDAGPCTVVGLAGMCYEFVWALQPMSRTPDFFWKFGQHILDGGAKVGTIMRIGAPKKGHTAIFAGYTNNLTCILLWEQNAGGKFVSRKKVCGDVADGYYAVPAPRPEAGHLASK
jgi:hypothetical protein